MAKYLKSERGSGKQLPRYTFDPVTQKYTLITPMESGLGALYDAGGDGTNIVGGPAFAAPPGGLAANPMFPAPTKSFAAAPNGLASQTQEEQERSRLRDGTASPIGPTGPEGNPAAGSSGVMGGLGQAAMGYGQAFGGFAPGALAANVVGTALTNQSIAQNVKTDQDLAQMQQQAIPSVVSMGPFGPVATPAYDVTVSPVANPTPATVTSIAPNPTEGLAAMNAQVATEQAEAANQASVANTAATVSEAVSQAADTTQSDTGAQAAADAAATDGGGIGSDGMGGFSDAGGEGPGGPGNAAGTAGVGDGEREGGMIRQRNYKAGGLASAAQHVQNQGRKGDSMLVHMSPSEVRGLQAIAMQHGGSLTVNPKTGLIEASFLNSILPMVAGAALAPFTGGASMAALLVGGGTALMTGSLEKGLMAGLGAFGGASLAGALTAPAVTGTQAGLQAVGQQALGTTALPAGVTAGGGAQASALMQQNIAMGMTPAQAAAQIASSASYAPAAAANIPASIASPTVAQMAATNAAVPPQTMTQGLKSLIQDAPGSRAAFMKEVGGTSGLISKVGMAAAPMLFSAEEPDEGGKKPQEYIRPYSFDFKPSAETDPDFRFRTGAPGESTAEQRYFAPEFKALGVYKAGTEPGPSFYGTPTEEQLALYSRPRQGSVESGMLGTGLTPFNKETIRSLSSRQFSAGGVAGLGKGGLKDGAFIVPADVVAHLGNGSNDAGQKLLARGLGARPIKGKGDGMSDSIATSIEGRQPARVADGEAYIPPEVVKKVGSKRLYNMMAKIRQARTGTKRQAPEVDPRKFMPA